MTVSSMDTMVAGFNAQGWPTQKLNFSPQAAPCWTALWTVTGNPGAGVNSSSGVAGDVPTSATAGAIPFSNSNNTYLSRWTSPITQIATACLYDRLWHNSGLSVTTTGAQTVNSVALTRGPGAGTAGEAVEPWLEVYTTLGAGSTAKTISYTNQSGTASKTGTLQSFVTTAAAGRAFQFSLASGDTGVRSIQSFDNVATSTSGTFGLVLRRYIASLNVPIANCSDALNPITGGLPRVYDSACLEILYFSQSTGSQSVMGNLAFCQN